MKEFNLVSARKQLKIAMQEFLDQADFAKESLIVLGSSTSEIQGQLIGKGSSIEVGRMVIDVILPMLNDRGLYLAVQGCQHLNRALLMERSEAEKRGYEEVTVIPAVNAGGATQVAAYERFNEPIEVEHITAVGGIDIGDTAIGQHVKFVQIPLRTSITEIGFAHITYLTSRPKMIGGSRAQYVWKSVD